jgi:teichuronic acid biosynthesis glycosyltransferase TuaH
MKSVDCLIVPLRPSRLIESVDPIKIYEYVNYGKPIMSVYYPELERYRPYVEFYKDVDELVNTVERLMAEGFPAKYTNSQRLQFLEQNSWSSRASQILGTLRNVLHADA